METKKDYLKVNDTIKNGIYTGETLKDLIEMNGKKIILRVMWSNEVDPDILKKYHLRHATKEEKIAWEEKQKKQRGNNTSKVDFLTSILYDDFDDDYPYGLRA